MASVLLADCTGKDRKERGDPQGGHCDCPDERRRWFRPVIAEEVVKKGDSGYTL